jgi:ferrous iron transport protein A
MTRFAAQLVVGQSARVARVISDSGTGQRLLEMGITPGVELRCLGTAPLGDPLEFEVRGYRLSLRKHEAEQIEIHYGDTKSSEKSSAVVG